jgi:hypothetical protein
MIRHTHRSTFTRCALAAATLVAGAAFAAPQAQPNLGRGLRELVDYQGLARADLAQPAARKALAERFGQAALAQFDDAGRVLVDVHLDGRRALAEVRAAAANLGAATLAEDARYRHGVLSVWLPVDRATALAQAPGVRAVLLAPPPVTHIGKATSQGVGLIHSDLANAAGFTGAGITVGALSDSYAKGLTAKGSASADVKSGDLPGAGNPDGFAAPVVVLKDSVTGEDEGRAMLQIIHDVAPAAHLCFATANSTTTAFAANIRALADPDGPCKADVIVDDVSYFNEPMFQDGVIAQAADDVTAQGVAYFSAAGNEPANNGYAAKFAAVDDATARALSTTVDLSLIPAGTTPGGFHNFAAASGGVDIAQTITLTTTGSRGSTIDFQWNDPWDAAAVQTDYDLYVFSADGHSVVKKSTDHNASTDEPIELGASGLPAGTYQLVIARADAGPAKPSAPQLRYTIFGDVGGGEWLRYDAPTIFGHTAAAGAISTGAVPFYEPYVPEPFTSTGPVTIFFDKDGNKLTKAVVRQKPDISAPDGGNTSFFVGDTTEDADTLPNFFGTSAAAPHAAAVAALLLQKAGGPGAIAPATLRSILQSSAPAHDLQPSFARATAKAGQATVTLTASGDGNAFSGANPWGFVLALKGPAGWTLQDATLDVSGANAQRVLLGVAKPGMQFDPTSTGFPFTIGGLQGMPFTAVTASPLNTAAPFSQQLSLAFAPGAFVPGASVTFGVDRDETALGAAGNSMDLLAGGTLSGTVLDADGHRHAFSVPVTTGKVGTGWNYVSGFGLVDAQAALALVP